MRRWIGFAFVLSLLLSPALGCGGATGPANPDETPKVSEDQIQQEINNSPAAKYKKQYENTK